MLELLHGIFDIKLILLGGINEIKILLNYLDGLEKNQNIILIFIQIENYIYLEKKLI